MMKVLLVASEGAPFIKTGGLADVIGALPKALKEDDVDVRVVLPYYKKIKNKNNAEYLGYCYVTMGFDSKYAGIFQTKENDITYYFIDNDEFFGRDGIYGYNDDGVRFGFYDFAVLEMLKVIDFYPDVIHANDWQTGLIPYILRTNYYEDNRYHHIKTLYSIHNIEYQGQFSRDLMNRFYMPYSLSLEYHFGINFMKSAIMEADRITTVSKTYKEEVLTSTYGYGLENVLKLRYDDFYGIVNGIDTQVFNPETDPNILFNYGANNVISKKKQNKKELLKMFWLDQEDAPLFGLVSRLASQKGIELLRPIIDEVLTYSNAKFILMGSGDRDLEDFFRYLEGKYNNRIKCYIGYNEQVAQKIYAGADIFLMPSKFEPCGLGQLIAMRYGTLPLVRETGGLKDTVIPYNKYTKEGTGFSFTNYNSYDLKEVIFLAIDTYNNHRDDFNMMIKKAMKKDFSWKNSAKEYLRIYKELKGVL